VFPLLDILSIWPEASDLAQSALVERDAYEWLVLLNVFSDRISIAKETHEEAILRGVPIDKKGEMKKAAEALSREGVLTLTPKENHPVYHADSRHPIFQTSQNIEILEELRINERLKKALIGREPLKKRIVAPIIRAAIDRQWGKRKGRGFRYIIEVDGNLSEIHGDFSARLHCYYLCPLTSGEIGPYTFIIKDVRELFEKRDVQCPICNKTHWIVPDGSIRNYE